MEPLCTAWSKTELQLILAYTSVSVKKTSIVHSSAADGAFGSGTLWEGGVVGQWDWHIPAQSALSPAAQSQWEETVGV